MPSSPEVWIRRFHTYAGLYFLFFTWLFCVSGLVLNHPGWRVAGFWAERQQELRRGQVQLTGGAVDSSTARMVISQLGIRGEISGKVTCTSAEGLRFSIVRPGDIYDVKVDRRTGVAEVTHTRVNRWGVLNMLHSFTGVRRNDPTRNQNWWATGVWRLSMDALSFGLTFMVLSGLYIWYSRGRHRRGGAVALLLGTAALATCLVGF